MNIAWIPTLLCMAMGIVSSPAFSDNKNGFPLDNALVPSDQIFQGGPPRDGIPSIDQPVFIRASETKHLNPNDRILGINLNGVIKAYPINIMNWHEIVNDVFGPEQVVVSFCPLCGTGMAFKANVSGRNLSFGVSGLLYQSDVLLYDRATNSLWSQVMAQAISGELRGEKLNQISMAHTTWEDWSNRHPDSLVLSRETGYLRDYERNPYKNYGQSKRLYFGVNHKAPAVYHPKEQVMGIKLGRQIKAYPFQEMSKFGKADFTDEIGNQTIKISWNEQARSAEAFNLSGTPLPSTTAFWFAWYTFHPETEVFKAP